MAFQKLGTSLSALALAALLALSACGSNGPATSSSAPGSPATMASQSGSPRVVDDELGQVTVPAESNRIATTAPAYTTAVLLLGGADKLVALEDNYGKNEWIKGKYPQLANLPVVFSGNEVNMEELLKQSPDLVVYANRYGENNLRQLQDLDIAAVSSPKGSDKEGNKIDQLRARQVYLGEVIGGVQLDKANKYSQEYLAIKSEIEAKTASIPESERPTVVQLSGAGDSLQANNGSAIGQELITLAGGVNAGVGATGESKGPSGQTKIDPEQLLSWDPELLLVDSAQIRDTITSDSTFSGLKAVKNNNIIVIPKGAMAWAYNGPEEYLNMYFFAKAVHPELFKDIDMEAKTKAFYKEYFGFDLDEADLKHLFGLSDGQSVEDVFSFHRS
ncbi:ABC transporter substrate-binding protein [Arachnia rubra]|jgi:predicted ABC transporter|uniref:ABC transporter substrate-binding protein n=1 Tax=Arachnia rubra TaxID=1547448 RepID=A0ABX7Y3E0_9ACTN|nr:ABC transporter substrate-binding protein [Arachnia rubra]QUC07380.1 ABC transporter substrate-binding protein [Arachnia rubra]BCR81663.1 peptide ABC transporter substrate-binding protein [Arachnia rubra]